MGRSKKEAEQKAASAAYKALEALDVLDTAGKTSV
jgi:ribonuclease-3